MLTVLLIVVTTIAAVILLAAMWNQLDVQRRGNGASYEPSVSV